jgi:hypothetical protein
MRWCDLRKNIARWRCQLAHRRHGLNKCAVPSARTARIPHIRARSTRAHSPHYSPGTRRMSRTPPLVLFRCMPHTRVLLAARQSPSQTPTSRASASASRSARASSESASRKRPPHSLTVRASTVHNPRESTSRGVCAAPVRDGDHMLRAAARPIRAVARRPVCVTDERHGHRRARAAVAAASHSAAANPSQLPSRPAANGTVLAASTATRGPSRSRLYS